METLKLKEILGELPYYTKQNLNLYLNKNDEALNYWIKTLIRKEALIPMKKGMYISSFYMEKVKSKNEMEEYLEYLANIMRYPSYISLEYALAKYGLIPESVFQITAITTKTTRKYDSKIITFSYRKIKDVLFSGFTEQKYGDWNIRFATAPKALFDYLYLKKFVSNSELENYLLERGRINWQILKLKDKKLFREYIRISSTKKMNTILKILEKNKLA